MCQNVVYMRFAGYCSIFFSIFFQIYIKQQFFFWHLRTTDFFASVSLIGTTGASLLAQYRLKHKGDLIEFKKIIYGLANMANNHDCHDIFDFFNYQNNFVTNEKWWIFKWLVYFFFTRLMVVFFLLPTLWFDFFFLNQEQVFCLKLSTASNWNWDQIGMVRWTDYCRFVHDKRVRIKHYKGFPTSSQETDFWMNQLIFMRKIFFLRFKRHDWPLPLFYCAIFLLHLPTTQIANVYDLWVWLCLIASWEVNEVVYPSIMYRQVYVSLFKTDWVYLRYSFCIHSNAPEWICRNWPFFFFESFFNWLRKHKRDFIWFNESGLLSFQTRTKLNIGLAAGNRISSFACLVL